MAQLRRDRNLTLAEVATAVGKHESVISRYERGETLIPDNVKAKLALRFGVTRAYLMGWDEGDVAA